MKTTTKKTRPNKTKIRIKINPKRKKNPATPNSIPGEAIEIYKGFHARNDVKIIEEDITIPKNLVFIGKATELNYQSDKWDGISRHYRHKLRTFGNILADPEGKMIIITGLNFKIKREGITG